MNMSLDRLFFFWRKGDSLLIEKREQDLFERMKNCIGCTYISDLPRYRYEVWEKMKRISLDQYTLKQLDDFCEYVFGIRYWMVKGRVLLKNQNVNKLDSCYKREQILCVVL